MPQFHAASTSSCTKLQHLACFRQSRPSDFSGDDHLEPGLLKGEPMHPRGEPLRAVCIATGCMSLSQALLQGAERCRTGDRRPSMGDSGPSLSQSLSLPSPGCVHSLTREPIAPVETSLDESVDSTTHVLRRPSTSRREGVRHASRTGEGPHELGRDAGPDCWAAAMLFKVVHSIWGWTAAHIAPPRDGLVKTFCTWIRFCPQTGIAPIN
jgi:hypothetical protein